MLSHQYEITKGEYEIKKGELEFYRSSLRELEVQMVMYGGYNAAPLETINLYDQTQAHIARLEQDVAHSAQDVAHVGVRLKRRKRMVMFVLIMMTVLGLCSAFSAAFLFSVR
jgi:hypothetical protein